jgi:hypothetical protein
MAIALLVIDVQQEMFMLSRPPHQGVVDRIAFDTPALSAAQIVAHHNLALGGFGELAATDEIRF